LKHEVIEMRVRSNLRHAVALVALCAAGASAGAAKVDDEMNRLASARGCARCHSLLPPKATGNPVPPIAPAWTEIAERYRGQPDAEDRLVAVVRRGSGTEDRHWAGMTRATKMPANALEIDEGDARQLIQWVLQQDRRRRSR
jgi:cytochrome c